MRAVLRNPARQDAVASRGGVAGGLSTDGSPTSSQPARQSDSVYDGRQIFETTACVNCHNVSGTNAHGKFGPDLTHLMSRETIAAGAAQNTPENLRLWIKDPEHLQTRVADACHATRGPGPGRSHRLSADFALTEQGKQLMANAESILKPMVVCQLRKSPGRCSTACTNGSSPSITRNSA